MARKSLDKTIREFMTEEVDDAKCAMISLVHMLGTVQKEIHTVKFGGKVQSEIDIANTFKERAESYAQDLAGTQTFQLLAFYGSSSEPKRFQPFTVSPQNEGQSGLMTEAPTDAGSRQQFMRQSEMVFQQMMRRTQTLDEFTLRVIAQQAVTIDTITRENRDAFAMMKEMLMERALNEHNREMEKLKFSRSTEERRKWISYIPPLANTVTGKEIFPQETEDTALVEAVADSLDEKSVMMLAQVLKPELLAPLMARINKFMEKKQNDQKAIAALSEVKTQDPESSAAGDVAGTPNLRAVK